MISDRTMPHFAGFTAMRTLRWIFAAVVLAAVATPGAADAATRRRAYDGAWNVTFTPQAGNCHASNTVPFLVSGTRVASAGGGKVTGGVGPNRIVAVRIVVGASWANGNGRLSGNSGAGPRSGLITGDRWSGIWPGTPG